MAQPRAKWNPLGFALLVFAAALLVRLPYLGRAALWGDEILFVRYMADVAQSPWQTFLGYWQHCIDFGQLPLGGVVLNAWMRAVGRFVPDVAHHAFALRLPGALAGALAVVGGFLLGRRLVRPEINCVATAMAAFFFFPTYYSREAYCYPYVLLCAAFALLFFHKTLFGENRTRASAAALLLGSAALGWTHFGCSVLLAAMGAAAGILWLWNARNGRPLPARRAAAATAACVLAGLAAAPYWARILLGDSPHVAMESPYSLFRILNDGVAKFFLGDRLLPAALAWGLFAAGLAALARRRDEPVPARVVVGLVVATALGLAILARKSQYNSVRYFAMLAPLVYLVFAQGLWTASRALARLFRRENAARTLFYVLAAAAAAVHLGLFLPATYRLEEKGIPYATTARWLNDNAIPGSPYFFDCGGFDQRYVPGYYATPGRIPTVDIAGNGPGFLDDVRDIQRRLMRRFPVSYYVRDPAAPWDEADRFYRNAVESRNPSLEKLRRYGIAPVADTRNANADVREILYNTRDDAIAMAREAGSPVFVDYPGFRCAPVVPNVYGRVVDGREAELVVLNLRETPLHGALRIAGAISSTNAQSAARLALPSGETEETTLPCGKIWTWETAAFRLPEGSNRLALAVADPAADKLLVLDVHFVERPTPTATPHAPDGLDRPSRTWE
ncbi:MAG: hypothetical protein AB7V14_08605 [Kiritimatiellia bacterium]